MRIVYILNACFCKRSCDCGHDHLGECLLQESKIPSHAIGGFSLDDALEDVLINNKEEFVRLFLEIGANTKTFLNENRLHNLYEKVPVGARFMTTTTIHRA